MFVFGSKGYGAQGVKHTINNWKKNSGFEDVRIFASRKKQIQGKNILLHTVLGEVES